MGLFGKKKSKKDSKPTELTKSPSSENVLTDSSTVRSEDIKRREDSSVDDTTGTDTEDIEDESTEKKTKPRVEELFEDEQVRDIVASFKIGNLDRINELLNQHSDFFMSPIATLDNRTIVHLYVHFDFFKCNS
jgi:hypothetical protein